MRQTSVTTRSQNIVNRLIFSAIRSWRKKKIWVKIERSTASSLPSSRYSQKKINQTISSLLIPYFLQKIFAGPFVVYKKNIFWYARLVVLNNFWLNTKNNKALVTEILSYVLPLIFSMLWDATHVDKHPWVSLYHVWGVVQRWWGTGTVGVHIHYFTHIAAHR